MPQASGAMHPPEFMQPSSFSLAMISLPHSIHLLNGFTRVKQHDGPGISVRHFLTRALVQVPRS